MKLHNLGKVSCLNMLEELVPNSSDIFVKELSVISSDSFLSCMTGENCPNKEQTSEVDRLELWE